MVRIRKILFPVDFSANCLGASHYVENLARHFQAEVTLLNVVSQNDYLMGTLALEETYKAASDAARKQLSGYLTGQFQNLDVKRTVADGDPAMRIVEYSKKDGTDLIMMPTYGLGPFRRFILGSMTAKVLHDAACPVWTGVHLENTPDPEEIAIRKVICAIDLGEQSEGTLRWAEAFAKSYDAELIVLHAVPAAETRPARYLDRDLVQTLIIDAEAEVGSLLQRLGIEARFVVEGGEPAKVARAVADREAAGLMVIARGAVTEGLGRLRTHSYSIIRTAPCPVVSV